MMEWLFGFCNNARAISIIKLASVVDIFIVAAVALLLCVGDKDAYGYRESMIGEYLVKGIWRWVVCFLLLVLIAAGVLLYIAGECGGV